MTGHRALVLGTTAFVAVGVRSISRRGGALRLASLLLHRLERPRRQRRRGPDDSRLYARGRRRLETHLGRLGDGRRAILALPVDGSSRSSVYAVDEARPWHDFERQAGLVGAAWGPCRSASAGL